MHGCAGACCTAATQAATAPEPERAVEAFLLARRWLDLDELPAPSESSSRLELPGVTGICVVLRQDGRLVGIGEDSRAGPLMLRRAVGRAVSKALADETVRGVRAVTRDRITARLSLQLELAGERVPLIGRTIGDASDRIIPGDEGIALQRADAVFMAFPSRLLATDSAARPDSSITALMVEAGLPAKDLPEFATEDRVSLSRFSTLRLRQDHANGTPTIVTRAGRVIDAAEITPAFTRGIGIRLVTRLAAHVVAIAPDDPARGVRLLGTYNPTADRYTPPFADARDAALAALALGEAAACDWMPEEVRRTAKAKCVSLAASLQRLPDSERVAPVDELCAITLDRIGGKPAIDDELSRRVESRMMATREGGLAEESIALAAVLAATIEDRVPALAARLARVAESAREDPAAALEAAIPLGLLARTRGLDPEVARSLRASLVIAATALRTQQLGADPSLGQIPRDLVGGIALPGTLRLRVDTGTLRFSAGFALGLGSQPPDPVVAALQKGTMRFLAQHIADDPWVGGFRRPENLRGLVRRSLAGDDCPPASTTLGLLLALGGIGDS